MRLIDADALKEKSNCECFDNPDYDYEYVFVTDIDDAPTIEAIPIEWIDDFLEILENVGTTNNMFGMSIPIIQALVATWRENKDIKNIDDNGKN